MNFVSVEQKLKISEFKQKHGAFQFYFLLLAITGGAFYLGGYWGQQLYTQQQLNLSKHQASIQNLKRENEQLVKKLNILGVELEVAKLTQQQHFVEVQQSIEREKNLRTQLGFYQQVMAPELKEQGFLIDGFNVEQAISTNSYRFELVLMQQNQTKNTLKGNLTVILLGSENGQTKQYPLEQLLSVNTEEKLTFSFKYFQVIEGEITLPDNFIPEQVSVHAEIFQFKRKKGELTTVFDWTNTNAE